MKRIAAFGGMLFVGGFLLLGTAGAGWVIESRNADPERKTTREVSYFQRDRIRAESEGSSHVMDFVARKIIMIDDKGKRFSVVTFEEYKKMIREGMKASREAMEEMKRRGISLPGASTRPAGPVTVSRIAGGTVAGYTCDGYRVSVEGTPREDLWIAKKIDLSGEFGPAVWKEFEELSREMKKMGMAPDDYEESAEYRKVLENGYPMKLVDKESGRTQEVTRAERKTIPASLFEEPKGYEKVPFDRMTFGSSPMDSTGTEAGRSGMEGAAGPASEGVGRRAADYGKQSADEAKDAASQGAQEPVREKKGEVLDSIREGAKEGIKKLFKW